VGGGKNLSRFIVIFAQIVEKKENNYAKIATNSSSTAETAKENSLKNP